MPIIPHFSSECLKIINLKSLMWPEYDDKLITENKINFVIQINGKKRGLINLHNNKSKEEVLELVKILTPRKTILTNMHSDLDYTKLKKRLPKNIIPGFDGITVNLKN